jgi:hypothetical protein
MCALTFGVALAGSAAATPLPLVDVGDGTVYDPNYHLIWLKNWNINGSHDWTTHNQWAEGLVFAGSDDWHLPTFQQAGNLWNEVGDLNQKSLPFENVKTGDYWTIEAIEDLTYGSLAKAFYPVNGAPFGPPGPPYLPSFSLQISPKYYEYNAVAVRIGDIVSVPEPQTLGLALGALTALGVSVVGRTRRSRCGVSALVQ